MSDNLQPAALDALSDSLGRTFWQVGVIGMWAQIVLAVAPVATLTAVFASVTGAKAPGGGLDLVAWLSVGGFAILLVTTVWSWRYMRRGRRLSQGAERAEPARLMRTVWIGLGASSLGILLSIVVTTVEMIRLLVGFLEAPQAGAMVVQSVGEGQSWISAVDILGMMTLVLTMAAEIVTLVLGLWLLYRISSKSGVAIG